MRYTRYDLKKKKNNSVFFIIFICIILIIAYASGTLISSLFIKNKNNAVKNLNKNGQVMQKNINNKNIKIDKFIGIQCGVFSSSNNAILLKEKISSYGNPFIVEENGKNKVILGIYPNTQIDKISKKLNDSKIEFSKINFEVNLNNLCNAQIIEVVDAYLQIINKLEDVKVKSVQTSQLKKWCSELKPISNDEQNFKVLNGIKEDIKKLPSKVLKDDCDKYNIYIYRKLKEVK